MYFFLNPLKIQVGPKLNDSSLGHSNYHLSISWTLFYVKIGWEDKKNEEEACFSDCLKCNAPVNAAEASSLSIYMTPLPEDTSKQKVIALAGELGNLRGIERYDFPVASKQARGKSAEVFF